MVGGSLLHTHLCGDAPALEQEEAHCGNCYIGGSDHGSRPDRGIMRGPKNADDGSVDPGQCGLYQLVVTNPVPDRNVSNRVECAGHED